MGHLVPVYVGETDEKAELEAAKDVTWLYHYGLRHKWEQFMPPGYSSPEAMQRIMENAAELDFASFSFKELNEKGYCIVGSADTVRERLSEYSKDLGFGLVLALTHFGQMDHATTQGNMARFAEGVMPKLREEFADMA